MLQVLEDCNLWKKFPKGLHILVVDKDPATLHDIKAKLEARRYRVTTFERSEDAVSALTNPESSFQVALIEADFGERLDGFDILDAENRKNIPTIMMSNTDNTEVMLRAFALGAVEILQKPLSDDKLKNVWQHAVRKALATAIEPTDDSQNVADEETLWEGEEGGLVIEGNPNLKGDAFVCEKFPAPSTPKQELTDRFYSTHENLDESSVSETTHNFKNEIEETRQMEAVEMTPTEDSASSGLDEVKKELDISSTESSKPNEKGDACTASDLNYPCDKMELDSSFDDFCMGMDGDLLSELDIDSDMFADFSLDDNEGLDIGPYFLDDCEVQEKDLAEEEALLLAEVSKAETQTQQLMADLPDTNNSTISSDISVKEELSSEGKKTNGREASKLTSKTSHGKRKIKVDWTQDLHRRFVQAVEQLGVDKAVPSRILELMGVNCLTRHNIASHLQKYRSHRKHLLAREAEAATWNHRRQLYATTGTRARPWIGQNGNPLIQPRPSIGFPPMAPASHAPFRPLHVWGHPTVDHSSVHMWQKHPMPAPAPWPSPDGYFWQQTTACTNPWDHNAPASGTPLYPQPLMRLPLAPVTGVPHFMPPAYNGEYYKPDNSAIHPVNIDVPAHLKSSSFHPSKEKVDAAINEVLSNPWTPLPLGLKSPSLESVMAELQRQGIRDVPPASA